MSDRTPNWLFAVAILSFVVTLANSFVLESLWLDECVSAWVTSGSVSDVVTRSIEYQGQSPLYYLILWSSRQLIGSSELGLRAPSIVFIVLSALLLYQLGRRYFGGVSALFGVALYLASDPIVVAISARPYALALFLSTLSIYCLLRWIDSQKFIDGLHYVAATLLTFYAHYLFALVVLLHVVILLRFAGRSSVSKPSFVLLMVGFLCSIPGIIQLGLLAERRTELSFAIKPGAIELVNALMPISFLVYLSCAVIGGLLLGKTRGLSSIAPAPRLAQFLLAWWLIAPITLFTIASFSDANLFLSRYFSWSYAGLALLGALVHSRLGDDRGRVLAVVILCILWGSREAERKWQIEDWRGAASQIQAGSSGAPHKVFVYSGLIESEDVGALTLDAEYLAAPFGYYAPNSVVQALPGYLKDERAAEYVVQALMSGGAEERFLVLVNNYFIKSGVKSSTVEEYKKLIAKNGMEFKELSSEGLVRVGKITLSGQ